VLIWKFNNFDLPNILYEVVKNDVIMMRLALLEEYYRHLEEARQNLNIQKLSVNLAKRNEHH